MSRRAILIKNAAIITGCGPVYPDGFVHIRDGRICAIGSSKSSKAVPGATTIDASGRYLLPGFINSHTHLYSSLATGMPVPGLRSFGEVLEGVWWKLDRALTLEDVYVSALVGAIASIRAGVTTVFDHHASYGAVMGSLGAVSRGVSEVGLRASLSYEISDRNGKELRDEALDESASWLEFVRAELADDPGFMQRGMVGLHASMTLSDETLELAREIMNGYSARSHVHVAEGEEDVRISKRKYKVTPLARFLKARMLDEASIAAHCVHVNAREITGLARTGACVAHNPLSNLNNAVGIAPILDMARKGVPVAVGTDGMSASIGCDMRLASLIHKLGARDASAGWDEAAYMIWEVAPWLASSSFGCDVGLLRRGAAADMILIDARPDTPLKSENALGHLLFNILGKPVRTTIVGGKVRMKDFKVVGVDEAKLAGHAGRRAKALWRRMK